MTEKIETEIYHYEDGGRGEFQTLNGKRHGSRTVFRADGSKAWENFYVQDQKSGPDRRWHPGGQLDYERHYVNDKLHGPWTSRHINGQVKSETYFENGEQRGEARWYTTDGKLLAEMSIAPDGTRHGTQIAEFMIEAGEGDLRLGIATYDQGEYQGVEYFDELPEGYAVNSPA